MYSLPDTPQPPLQVWAKGIELGMRIYGRLFLFTSLLAVLGLLPRLDLGLRMANQVVTMKSLRASLDARWILIELVCILLSLLVDAVIIARLGQSASVESVVVAPGWRQAFRSWLPLLGATLLCVLVLIFAVIVAAFVGGIVAAAGKAFLGHNGAMAIDMLLLFVAVVFLGVYLIFVQFAVVLEGKRPLAAINSSFNLVRGNWWRTFIVLLITGVVLAGVLLLVSLLAGTAFGWQGGVQTGRVLLEKSILQMVLSALTAPFVVAILYMQYLDLKLRRTMTPPPVAAFRA